MVFDTLFHVSIHLWTFKRVLHIITSQLTHQQTIPPETYTYALPPADIETQMPLRKYGFHGLSYASIVRTLAKYRGKSEQDVNLVVAHLGSGASACCIKGGKSIDTCEFPVVKNASAVWDSLNLLSFFRPP
jgi:acetate kinase